MRDTDLDTGDNRSVVLSFAKSVPKTTGVVYDIVKSVALDQQSVPARDRLEVCKVAFIFSVC